MIVNKKNQIWHLKVQRQVLAGPGPPRHVPLPCLSPHFAVHCSAHCGGTQGVTPIKRS